MSGRKASEVNGLLRNGEKTRKGSMESLDSSLRDANNALAAARKKYGELSELSKNIRSKASKEARQTFPNAVSDVEAEITELRASLDSDSLSDLGFEKCEETRAKILRDYSSTDSRAEAVRQAIQRRIKNGKQWYCDKEYADAREVTNDYKQLGKRVDNLRNDYSAVSRAANQYLSKVGRTIDRLHELASRLNELDDQAKRTREVQSIFESIDSKLAEKFLAKEYETLRENVKNSLKSITDYIFYDSGYYRGILSEITDFETKLQKKHAEFLEIKSSVKADIDSLNKRLENKVYSVPEDEFRKGEPRKMNLMDFLSQYAKGRYNVGNNNISEINDLMKSIKGLYNEERFDEAKEKIGKAVGLINEASSYAALTHGNKMKTIQTALDIRETMVDLGYYVRTSANKDSDDGFCIECRIGDEIINFDKVTVTDDGKPVIDINHKEDTKGTCAKSWPSITSKLAEKGLFFEDIKKDGVSIFKHDTKAQSQISTTESTSHY